MQIRHVGPNLWQIVQRVPNPSGLSFAPPRDEVLLTLTDEDLVSVLDTLAAIDGADHSVSTLMEAHVKSLNVDAHLHDTATDEGMPESVPQVGS